MVKKLVSILMILGLSYTAGATVDAMTEGWIVTRDINDDTIYGVKKVPIIGCYGVSQGPQLEQFTNEFLVQSSMGCGSGFAYGTENINILSCAELESAVESDNFTGFKKITLDISNCADKDNAKFITMVRTAAARNFPQYDSNYKVIKGKDVELILNK